MSYGFCHLAVIPLRETASDTSQMVSQLLFGDVFEIIESSSSNWLKIRNAYDSYEGFIDAKQCIIINQHTFDNYLNVNSVNKEMISIKGNFGSLLIPPACSLYPTPFNIGNWSFDHFEKPMAHSISSREEVIRVAKSYLNAPYLWGGKTPFGIDCSGFTQSVYKIAGIKLWRDASQQANQGETLSFLEEAQGGDLAFFDNEEGQIIHVGILLSNEEIIHASGRVRIDKIDHAGIFNSETGKYTHQLRLLKSYLV